MLICSLPPQLSPKLLSILLSHLVQGHQLQKGLKYRLFRNPYLYDMDFSIFFHSSPLNQTSCCLTFLSLTDIIKVSAFMIISIFEPFLSPGCRNPVAFRQSGFSKSTYLESTCYGEISDAKIFKLVRDPVLLKNCHFQPFFLICHLCLSKTARN